MEHRALFVMASESVKEAMERCWMSPTTQILHLSLHDSCKGRLELSISDRLVVAMSLGSGVSFTEI